MDHTGNKSSHFCVLSCEHDVFQIKFKKIITDIVNSNSSHLSRAAHRVKSEDARDETAHAELRRQLRCVAYDALVAIISCTQTDMKFFTAFLFTEKPEKVRIIYILFVILFPLLCGVDVR